MYGWCKIGQVDWIHMIRAAALHAEKRPAAGGLSPQAVLGALASRMAALYRLART